LEISNKENVSFNDEELFLTSERFEKFIQNQKDLEYFVDDYCDKNGLKMMLCKKNSTRKMPKI
jgi:predicted peroxiredoxin